MSDVTAVIKDIVSGNYDEHLDGIRQALKARQSTLGSVNFFVIKPGDTGRLKNCRPLYLNGAPFTVEKKNQKKIGIRIDSDWLARNPKAKHRWSGTVICPPEMLEINNG